MRFSKDMYWKFFCDLTNAHISYLDLVPIKFITVTTVLIIFIFIMGSYELSQIYNCLRMVTLLVYWLLIILNFHGFLFCLEEIPKYITSFRFPWKCGPWIISSGVKYLKYLVKAELPELIIQRFALGLRFKNLYSSVTLHTIKNLEQLCWDTVYPFTVYDSLVFLYIHKVAQLSP